MILTEELLLIINKIEDMSEEIGSSASNHRVKSDDMIELKKLCEQFLHNEQVVNLDKLPKLKR